ncbi:MAG: holo-ACP synthase [Candidatus Gastranaerophilales bacterium]|nr:holo-ACP synthase [Candidatus Gastranaerophilales bacterium]
MNTNLSQGIDIEEIIRFEKYENDINSKFLNRIFTKNELDYCFSKKNPAQHLTARFCAKEASIKALFPFENKKLFLKQIEVTNENNYPQINILTPLKNKYSLCLSISHSKLYAIASVIAIKLYI